MVEFKDDIEVTTSHYHKMACAMYRWEAETEKLMERWNKESDEVQQQQEWKFIKSCMGKECVDMYREMLGEETDDAHSKGCWRYSKQRTVTRI